ncbi:hypothetical protein GCM10008939_22380 [Deinococcus aquiradiocola]|uniref:Uncharacterized protein n=1 Tax=Deinococcus aquiradiocola TaxID=393059 RepID=A0A917UQY6_9DEIO|nr:hypothetical protein GCM10008939_22380 [Deinococcus aquiradiocola]
MVPVCGRVVIWLTGFVWAAAMEVGTNSRADAVRIRVRAFMEALRDGPWRCRIRKLAAQSLRGGAAFRVSGGIMKRWFKLPDFPHFLMRGVRVWNGIAGVWRA